MTEYYNFQNIRNLLMEGFDMEELLTFCFDFEDFRFIYSNRPPNQTKNDLVRAIIDRGYQRLRMEIIFDWAKQASPIRYEQHLPYLKSEVTTTKETLDLSFSLVENGNLGYGITISEWYLGVNLLTVAANWVSYGEKRFVRSGWLYTPQWGQEHAITFFKLHVYEDGHAYIHIVDTADPVHYVQLETSIGYKVERQLHYNLYPTEILFFHWKEEQSEV
nr:hypothetical protein [Oscillochloris trichoides]